MSLHDHPTYYDVLDVKPDASPHEIREAYLRTKATYNKDSAALYTLISPEEREKMLQMIEEAHEVLSNPGKRKEYDRYHGLLEPDDDFSPRPSPTRKIVSIDRVPPMETHPEGDDLLVAPATDIGAGSPFRTEGQPLPSQTDSPSFEQATASADSFFQTQVFPPPAPQPPAADPSQSALPPSAPPASRSASPQVPPPPAQQRRPESPGQVMISPFMHSPAPPPPSFTSSKAAHAAPADPATAALTLEIEAESEWSGGFLRHVREVRKLSIEEVAGITKINKSYIMAIEEENFGKLPAAVFVRGFVSQIARTLKLPVAQVVNAYLARFNHTQAERL